MNFLWSFSTSSWETIFSSEHLTKVTLARDASCRIINHIEIFFSKFGALQRDRISISKYEEEPSVPIGKYSRQGRTKALRTYLSRSNLQRKFIILIPGIHASCLLTLAIAIYKTKTLVMEKKPHIHNRLTSSTSPNRSSKHDTACITIWLQNLSQRLLHLSLFQWDQHSLSKFENFNELRNQCTQQLEISVIFFEKISCPEIPFFSHHCCGGLTQNSSFAPFVKVSEWQYLSW